MEPVQQFCEVKGKFPKFVPSTTIPTAGVKNLKTLELQQVKKINLIKKIYIYLSIFQKLFQISSLKFSGIQRKGT